MNSTPERRRVSRFVALGDSQTEGLHDYGQDGLPRGWADRFAEHLAASNPALLYANLAVRGRRTAEVHREQLEVALDLAPDLATLVAGVNDVLLPRTDLAAVARDLETMYAALAETGCLVMGCSFPLPAVGLARRAAPRLQALNALLREAASRHGVLLVEMEGVSMASDLRLWDADRIHLNPEGHRRLADAFAGTLSGRNAAEGMEPLPPTAPSSAPRRAAAEAAWMARFLVPKIIRMLRGRSSGDGRSAKRPVLSPVERPRPRAADAAASPSSSPSRLRREPPGPR